MDGGPDGGTASGTAVLTTIPRKSTITAIDANIESATTINISRASNNFTHTITWSFSDLSGTIATKTSETSLGWTIPSSFYAKIPNAKSGTVTLTCTTYNGNTSLGSTTTTFTASVPTSGTHDSTPVISNIYVDTHATGYTDDPKRFIRYHTPVRLTLSGSCVNYASFVSLVEGGSNEITPTTSTSGGTTSISVSNETIYARYINRVFDGNPITVVLTDSRGLSTTKVLSEANGDFTVVPYIIPTISAYIKRVSPTSNDVNISFNGNFYNGFFDEAETRENYINVRWRYKETNGDWIPVSAGSSNVWRYFREGTDYDYVQNENKYESVGNITIQNLFEYQKDYVIEIQAEDELEYASSFTATINKGIPYFDYGEDNNGENYFNVNGNIYKNNQSINGVILYEDANGESGDIVLSETSANFDYLEIFLNRSGIEYYTKISSPNGKSATAMTSQYYNNVTYLYIKKLSISGTNITIDYNIGQEIGGTSFTDTANKIIKVIGYN